MSEDLLLTELCMICHINPYKYCCPRCSKRTCSLPCLKRHKQWASCNGIRNRAAYIKSKDLATSKAIDHDYNYLTSIERQLDNAERHAKSCGILLYHDHRDGKRRRKNNPAKGEVPLQAAIQQNRVIVDRAPRGMSRQKRNKTHWDSGKQHIVWTVEWVHRDGSRQIGQCPDSQPLNAAYARIAATLTPHNTGGLGSHARPRKKLKLNPEVPASTAQAAAAQTHGAPAKAVTIGRLPEDPSLLSIATILPSASKSGQKQPPELNFYLLLPSTPTSYRVLIPLASEETLAQVLADRFVLEFPTIYVLKQPPDRLPTGFMTDEEYLRGMAEKGPANRHLEDLLNAPQGLEENESHGFGTQSLDEGALRAVIKQDLISVVDAG
ncbi:MAG: hypothetical protein Q9218_003527 [Villophora microphyllina]